MRNKRPGGVRMNEQMKNNSELLFTQAKQQFEILQQAFEDGTIKQETQLIEQVFQSFESYFVYMGKPNYVVREANEDGPPWSEDYNAMMNELMSDLTLLYREAEILSAGLYTDFNHHVVQQELIEENYNSVLDKLRDLEMYHQVGEKQNQVFARDHFLNSDKIDYEKIATAPLEIQNGNVTLPFDQKINVAPNATITIVPGNKKAGELLIGAESNGFPGNNTEVSIIRENVLSTRSYAPIFLGGDDARNDYSAILDGNPNTWFEYERVNIREHDKTKVAKNFGLHYEAHKNNQVLWAEDPVGGVLKLHLQIVLEAETTINGINVNLFTPTNFDAKTATIKNILVGDGTNPSVSVINNKQSGVTTFYFEPIQARVITVLLEQSNKYITDIGHVYYQKKGKPAEDASYAIEMVTKVNPYESRIDGPLMKLTEMGSVVNESNQHVELFYPLRGADEGSTGTNINSRLNRMMGELNDDEVELNVERFEGFRWAIGIRDIEIFEVTFKDEGELVTKPFYFNDPVEKISLNIDEGDTLNQEWLSYYVSIDDGASYVPITPMTRINGDAPKIYTIRTVESDEQKTTREAGYLESVYPVYSIRLKIVGKKSDFTTFSNESGKYETPVLHSFNFNIELGNSSEQQTEEYVEGDESNNDMPFLPDPDPTPGNNPSPGPAPGGDSNPNPTPPPIQEGDGTDRIRVWITNGPLYQKNICPGKNIQLDIRVKSPHNLTKYEIYVGSKLIETVTVSGKKEVVETKYIDYTKFTQELGDNFTVKVVGYDEIGDSADEGFIVAIVDCADEGDYPNPKNGSIKIVQKKPEEKYRNGYDHLHMCTEDWLGLYKYCIEGRVESTSSPIVKIEFYEKDVLKETIDVNEQDNKMALGFEFCLDVPYYIAGTNYVNPYVIGYNKEGKKVKANYYIHIISCATKPAPITKFKVDIVNKLSTWCSDKNIKIKGLATSDKDISKIELYENGIKIGEMTTSGTSVPFEFTVLSSSIREQKYTYVVKAYSDNREATDSTLTTYIDCSKLPPGEHPIDPTEEEMRIHLDGYSEVICSCQDDLEFVGSIQSAFPISSVTYSINGNVIDPNNLGTPVGNPCGSQEGTPPVPGPDPTPDPTPQPPKEGCRAFFAGGPIGGHTNPGVMTGLWKPDQFSEYVGSGDHPKAYEAFPNSIKHTFDGVAIDVGTRLEVWSGENFEGQKLFDRVGPLIASNVSIGNEYLVNLINSSLDKHPDAARFPMSAREWIQFEGWAGGSIRISCEPVVEPPIEEPPVQEPTYSNGVTQPSISLAEFCTTDSGSIDTNYWVGSKNMPHTIVNGFDFNPSDKFWEGRNDWLDLIQHILNQSGQSTPVNRAKVDASDPFYAFLYKFASNVNKSSVVLPEPFSRFNAWCDIHLSCLSKLKRGTIYATYKFKKPAIIHPTGLTYLTDGVLETMAKYLLNTKLKRFTYHWIDFADIKPDPGTLAWVMDLTGLNQFLSYVNFEETAMTAGLGNMKAIRPISYTINAGQGHNEGSATLHENVLAPYYQATDHFKASDSYFKVGGMDPTILGIYAAMESAVHEIGHSISNYGLDAYPTMTNHKYPSDVGKVLHDYLEWYEISGWDRVSTVQDGKSKFTKAAEGSLLSNGKEAPVSAYGCTSPAEDFADAFDFYVINPELLKDKYPKKFAFMEKFVRNMPNHEISPFGLLVDELKEINVSIHMHNEGHANKEIYQDFGDWLEQFEYDENCGCKKRKKTTINNMENISGISQTFNFSMQSTEEKSFNIKIPYWKLYALGARPGGSFTLKIKAQNINGGSVEIQKTIQVKDCENPPTDENGNPRVRDCLELDYVHVHYYDYLEGALKQTKLAVNVLPYRTIKNEAGAEVIIGWNRLLNGVTVFQSKGETFPGFQIHAVGLEYRNEYNQSEFAWASDILKTTPNNRMLPYMLGDPATKSATWVTELQAGDVTNAPTIGGAKEYAVLGFGSKWEQKSCIVNSDFNIDKEIDTVDNPPEPPPEVFDCNAKQFVAVQYYDDQNHMLRMYQIDIMGAQGTVYPLPVAGGTAEVIVGWSNYFNGPVIQVKEGAGQTNVLLTAIGLVYRDKTGASKINWAQSLRHRTNGVQRIDFALGGPKTLTDLYWAYDGSVVYEEAPYLGKKSDLAAFMVSEIPLEDECESSGGVDEEIGIDPDNPPDVPKIEWNTIVTEACGNKDESNAFEGTIRDSVALKSFSYYLEQNGAIVDGPYETEFSNGEAEYTFVIPFNGREYLIGQSVKLHVTMINSFDRTIEEVIEVLITNCDMEKPVIHVTSPTQTNYCYDQLVSPLMINLGFYITDDVSGVQKYKVEAEGFSFSSEIYEEGLLQVDPPPIQIPIILPTVATQKEIVITTWDYSGKMTEKRVNLNMTACTPPPPVGPPPVDEGEITNEYKVLIRSKWGAMPRDMDIYVYVNREKTRRLSYASGGQDLANQIYAKYSDHEGTLTLNFDYTDHSGNQDFDTKYEVVTVNRFENKGITIILDHRGQGIDPSTAPIVEIVRKDTGAIVHSATLPVNEWTNGQFMRVCEFKLDSSGNFSSIIRGKASIVADDPAL